MMKNKKFKSILNKSIVDRYTKLYYEYLEKGIDISRCIDVIDEIYEDDVEEYMDSEEDGILPTICLDKEDWIFILYWYENKVRDVYDGFLDVYYDAEVDIMEALYELLKNTSLTPSNWKGDVRYVFSVVISYNEE